mgnify:CR=1 FL=1
MSDDTLAVVAVVVSAVLALFAFVPLHKGARKAPRGRASPEPEPPQDPAVNVARVLVEEVLAEKVEEVDEASNSASPADELAALGNKRKR